MKLFVSEHVSNRGVLESPFRCAEVQSLNYQASDSEAGVGGR